jgi:hypothetical protein
MIRILSDKSIFITFLVIAAVSISIILAGCAGNNNATTSPEVFPSVAAVETEAEATSPISAPTESSAPFPLPVDTQIPQPSPDINEIDDQEQDAAIDPCLLLPRNEAESALGKPVGEPTRESFPPIFSCTYTTDDFDQITIILVEYDGPAHAAASFQMELDINNYEEVNGIGERSLRPYPVMDLSTLIRNYEVSIDLATGDADQEFLVAQELMVKVLERLP